MYDLLCAEFGELVGCGEAVTHMGTLEGHALSIWCDELRGASSRLLSSMDTSRLMHRRMCRFLAVPWSRNVTFSFTSQ